MKKIIQEILTFYKNPKDTRSENLSIKNNIKYIFYTFVLNIIVSLPIILSLIYLVDYDSLPKDTERIDYNSNTIWLTTLSIVILVPLFEEIIFRLPIRYNKLYSFLFTRKTWTYIFKTLVYLLPIVFALVHLTNHGEINQKLLLYSPILIGSQLISGYFYTFLRVRFNFISALICHSLWNLLSTFIPFLIGVFEKPYEKKTTDIDLYIKYYEFNDLKKQKFSIDSSGGKIYKIESKQFSINHIVDTIANEKRNDIDFIIDLKFESKEGVSKEEFKKLINEYDDFNNKP